MCLCIRLLCWNELHVSQVQQTRRYVPLVRPGHRLQAEVSVTVSDGPTLVTLRRPFLKDLIRDTSTVTEPLGEGVKDVTLPVMTKKRKNTMRAMKALKFKKKTKNQKPKNDDNQTRLYQSHSGRTASEEFLSSCRLMCTVGSMVELR